MRLMHQTYQAEVHRYQPYTVREELRWDALLHAIGHYGVTGDEAVRLVARRLLRLDAEGRKRGFDGWQHKYGFNRFVDEGFFCEMLSAALAEARKPAKPANVVAMESLTQGRKYEAPSTEAITAAKALERTKLAEQLRQWREQNK